MFFDVRFAPNSDHLLRCREVTLCAISDQSAAQQSWPVSITSSAMRECFVKACPCATVTSVDHGAGIGVRSSFRTFRVTAAVTVALIAAAFVTPETFGQTRARSHLPFPGTELTPNNPPQLPQRPASQQLPGAGGTWQLSATRAPSSGGLVSPLLLTDGTVILQQVNSSNWYKLTPDAFGNYVNGTWSQIASLPSGYAPRAFASAVLPDGRVIVEGGEYNASQNVWTSLGAIYDPVGDAWTPVSPPSGTGWINTTGQPGSCNGGIGDAESIVLPNGTFLLSAACAAPPVDALFNATNLTWSSTGSPIGPVGKRSQDEAGYTLLQTDKVLMIDIRDPPAAQIYNPPATGEVAGSWTSIAPTPVALPDTCGTAEIGPAVTRPDGTVVAFGGNTCTATPADPTAIYNPFNNTWIQGPNVPATCGTNGTTSCTLADAPGAMLPNGNILFAASAGYNQTPAHWFEFTNSNTINQVADDFFASNASSDTYVLLVLPNGQILATAFSSYVEFYTPVGTFQPSWQPVITSVVTSLSAGSSYSIAGSQLNGLSQGGAYGDDHQMATNYPLVRITNTATNHVFYARTFNHSTMSIAPNTAGSTNFTVPANAEDGASTLVVVANGIPSQPVAVTISNGVPLEILTVSTTGNGTVTSTDGTINCPSTCSTGYLNGTQVTLTAAPSTGYSFSGWTGACSGLGSCMVTMNSAINVLANFIVQRDRVFVSSNGSDSNPCTFLSPCKTFQQAVSVVAPGGEVSAIDSAGFGPITITKSVTLTSPNGIEAGIVPAAGANAITINAGPTDAVVLRGLTLNGSGVAYNGIVFNSGGSLTVTDCVVENFFATDFPTGNGILIQPSSASTHFFIANTVLANNGGAGILYYAQSGPTNTEGVIDNVLATGNADGIYFYGPGSAAVRNSNATKNNERGIIIAQGTTSIDNVNLSGNAIGIMGANNSTVLLGRSIITGNGTGIFNSTSPNNFFTYKDNSINGNNNTDVLGTPLNTLTLQ
jgi:hypothetical protein